jgi:hypothetical protein
VLDVARRTAGYFKQPNYHSASLTSSLRFIVAVSPEALTVFPHTGENVMLPNDVCPDEDSFEQALCEYREQT